ncbi:MBL fold metallo-hydrolase [Euzebyella saccharophila]|uniref:MBL fold metallo-hydrolase n=1 Tax=Euzebyella saccharophila TaxID=679664 RepID=A0ABV8JTV7_9FLAO|nr:MBL fold metallo-hydrolase [Euzebyella saccharophila]
MLATIGILIGLVILLVVLFVNFSPQFGGKATKEQLASYAKSAHFKEGKFFNLGGVKNEMSAGDMAKAIGGMFKKIPNAKPDSPLAVHAIDSTAIANYSGETRFIWFGHSTFLLQIKGKNILLDPMFGDVPAPHPMLGSKRFSNGLPIAIEKLPRIDAVILSHDHYDHLDYESIKKLKHKVDHFYMPLGLGNHLREWDVEAKRITELDWWQEATMGDFTFTSTPAQHFSGRGLTDRDKTLWSSWVIQTTKEKIFFSGDSGYGPHFKTIGEKFGAFDFAMIECGQYNELWSEIHMFPEETAQVGLDINAKAIMPIHWGAFKLAQHSWTDPVERAVKKAKEINVSIITPQIGIPTSIHQELPAPEIWWEN